MQIDYSPLSHDINDEDIKKFCVANRPSLHIVSKRFCNIAYSIIALVLVIELMISVAAGLKFNTLIDFIFVLLIQLLITGVPIVIMLVIILSRNQTINSIKKTILLTDFANRNGFSYREFNSIQSYPGMMFNIGRKRKMYDQLLKESPLNTFEVSNYQYFIDEHDSIQVEMGYVMIKLGKKLPHMLLDSNANNAKLFKKSISNLSMELKLNQKLSLEGDFDKYFTLYAPKEYKRDALYIFTPDLMEAFIDWSGSFDAEVIDDTLFIYSSIPFNLLNPDEMKKIFNIVKIVGDKMFSRADKYSDEKVGNRSKNVVAIEGQRLKKKSFLLSMFIFMLLTAIFTIAILGISMLVISLISPGFFQFILELEFIKNLEFIKR